MIFLSLLITLNLWAYECFNCDPFSFSKEYKTRQRFDTELNEKVEALYKAPFHRMNYIAQGLTKEKDKIFLSYYYKNIYGENPEGKNSIVVEFDLQSKKIINLWRLNRNSIPFTGHVGGMIILGKYFAIVDGTEIIFFQKDEAKLLENNGSYKIYISESKNILVPDRGKEAINTSHSFINKSVDFSGKTLIWTGQFKEKPAQTQILGYEVISDDMNSNPLFQFNVPKEIYQIQGVTLVQSSPDRYLFLVCSSFGNHPSKISLLEYSLEKKNWILLKYETFLTAPSGLENIHSDSNGIWTISESGARYFQERRKPWIDDFPFIIKLPAWKNVTKDPSN